MQGSDAWNTGTIQINLYYLTTIDKDTLDDLYAYLNKGILLDIDKSSYFDRVIYRLKHPDFPYKDETRYEIIFKVRYNNLQPISYIAALATYKNGETVIVREYDCE